LECFYNGSLLEWEVVVSVVDVLRDAKQLIVTEGWWQAGQEHDRGDGRIRACAVSSVTRSGFGSWDRIDGAITALTRVIGVSDARVIADWNDAPERTLEDVLSAFDRAIELASPEAGLDGPSRRITVEPVEVPQEAPVEEPAQPAPTKVPEKEPVPA
jgi:hypothetical protein